MFRDLTITPAPGSPAAAFLADFLDRSRPHPSPPLPYVRAFGAALVGVFALSDRIVFVDWYDAPPSDRGHHIADLCDLADRHGAALVRITSRAAMARLLRLHRFTVHPVGDMWAAVRNGTPAELRTANALAWQAGHDAERAAEWAEQRIVGLTRAASRRRC